MSSFGMQSWEWYLCCSVNLFHWQASLSPSFWHCSTWLLLEISLGLALSNLKLDNLGPIGAHQVQKLREEGQLKSTTISRNLIFWSGSLGTLWSSAHKLELLNLSRTSFIKSASRTLGPYWRSSTTKTHHKVLIMWPVSHGQKKEDPFKSKTLFLDWQLDPFFPFPSSTCQRR